MERNKTGQVFAIASMQEVTNSPTINCETKRVKPMREITEDYFMFLVGEINRGTSSKRVHRVLQINGRFKYFLC